MSKEKTMTDAMGREIPVKYVPKYDRDNDRIVQRIFERFRKARAVLEDVMIDTLEDLNAVRGVREKNDRKAEGAKGNICTTSFDGNIKVECRVRYEIALDDRVAQARELMLEYVNDALGKVVNNEAKQALLPLVQDAFKETSTGRLSMARVMSLLRVNITAPKWLEARKLLVESMKGTRGKSYIIVSQRPDRNHNFKQIRLDLADCWPTAE